MMHKSLPIDRALLALLVFISLPIQSSLSASSASINAIRVGDYVHYTQIAVEMNGSQIPCSAVPFSHNPPILVLKFRGLTAGAIGRTLSADSVSFKKISVSQNPGELWMTIPVSSNVDLNNITCISGDGAVLINLHFKRPNYSKIPSPEKIAEFRKNGGKVVVIDPGHGGHDTGTAGVYTNPPHLVEKDVVLEIGKKLKRLVDSHPQMMGILIRDGDYYPMPPDVPFSTSLAFRSKALDYRVNLAKEYKGDIYVSLHLNAPAYRKYHKTVRGYEIYIFDETAATTLAEEWRSSEFDAADSVTIKDAIGSKVLMDMILNSSQLSKELATSITHEVDRIPEMVIRPNPIKASPKFKVLKHLNMPSVLIEYIFLTHPIEHEYVRKDRNKETLAHATYEGIRKYFFEREQVIAMTSRPLTTNSNKVVSNPVESEIDAILAQIPKVTPTAPKIETSTVASSARSNPSAPKSTAVQTKTTQTPTKPIQAPP
ncbi:MAG: N-acetylmuramoyl-L-alanine amidase, partial [bacterium]|nr:N-acetylmuramoyl-L-alanine amidase [bacterium]